MSDNVVISIINTVGLIVVAVLGGRRLGRIGRDVAVTREQAENEHDGTPYPNLRDELTATRETAERAVETVERAAEAVERVELGQRRHDKEIGGIREDVRQLRSEHGETRERIADEADERRRLAEGMSEHLVSARRRDERITELAEQVAQAAERARRPDGH